MIDAVLVDKDGSGARHRGRLGRGSTSFGTGGTQAAASTGRNGFLMSYTRRPAFWYVVKISSLWKPLGRFS